MLKTLYGKVMVDTFGQQNCKPFEHYKTNGYLGHALDKDNVLDTLIDISRLERNNLTS